MGEPDRPQMKLKYGAGNIQSACQISEARIHTLIMFNTYYCNQSRGQQNTRKILKKKKEGPTSSWGSRNRKHAYPFLYMMMMMMMMMIIIIIIIIVSRYIYSLQSGLSGDRNPVGPRFSSPVHTGSGTHLASCTMDTGSLSGWQKSPWWRWPPTPL